jgi:hypothetical protein
VFTESVVFASRHAVPRNFTGIPFRCSSQEQLLASVRGDCGFGKEPFIVELEDRSQSYLFKLRQTSGIKKMLRQFIRKDWTPSCPGPGPLAVACPFGQNCARGSSA